METGNAKRAAATALAELVTSIRLDGEDDSPVTPDSEIAYSVVSIQNHPTAFQMTAIVLGKDGDCFLFDEEQKASAENPPGNLTTKVAAQRFYCGPVEESTARYCSQYLRSRLLPDTFQVHIELRDAFERCGVDLNAAVASENWPVLITAITLAHTALYHVAAAHLNAELAISYAWADMAVHVWGENPESWPDDADELFSWIGSLKEIPAFVDVQNARLRKPEKTEAAASC